MLPLTAAATPIASGLLSRPWWSRVCVELLLNTVNHILDVRLSA